MDQHSMCARYRAVYGNEHEGDQDGVSQDEALLESHPDDCPSCDEWIDAQILARDARLHQIPGFTRAVARIRREYMAGRRHVSGD